MRKVVLGLGISLDGYIARPMERWTFSSCPRTIRWARFSPPSIRRSWGARPYDVAPQMGRVAGLATQNKELRFLSFRASGRAPAGVTFVNESPKSFVETLREGPGKTSG